VSLATAIIDVIGTNLRRRRKGGTPVGYSGREVLRREQCDMVPESRNSGARTDGGF
jgi:hypothetical protein